MAPSSTRLGSNNPFPSVLFERQSSTPSTPSAGHCRIWVRDADGHLCVIDDTGTVTDLTGIGTILDADPVSPPDGTTWTVYTAGSPPTLEFKGRVLGTTVVIASVTL